MMQTVYLITYNDGNGNITERSISEITFNGHDKIEAYCHNKNEKRTFSILKILSIIDKNTGEVINPYKIHYGENYNRTIEGTVWYSINAIKVLCFFSRSVRGFAKRERMHVIQFMCKLYDLTTYKTEEIDSWLQELWCGNVYEYKNGKFNEYEQLLKHIPESTLPLCKHFALLIAKGSGRAPTDPTWIDKIESEFCQEPIVKLVKGKN